jgi:hypothetical protein
MCEFNLKMYNFSRFNARRAFEKERISDNTGYKLTQLSRENGNCRDSLEQARKI